MHRLCGRRDSNPLKTMHLVYSQARLSGVGAPAWRRVEESNPRDWPGPVFKTGCPPLSTTLLAYPEHDSNVHCAGLGPIWTALFLSRREASLPPARSALAGLGQEGDRRKKPSGIHASSGVRSLCAAVT